MTISKEMMEAWLKEKVRAQDIPTLLTELVNENYSLSDFFSDVCNHAVKNEQRIREEELKQHPMVQGIMGWGETEEKQ